MMSDYGKLAKAFSGIAVGAYEVFFLNEESAKKCAEKYGAELHKLDDGWLVKKQQVQASDDDPIVQAIRKALQEAGLISN